MFGAGAVVCDTDRQMDRFAVSISCVAFTNECSQARLCREADFHHIQGLHGWTVPTDSVVLAHHENVLTTALKESPPFVSWRPDRDLSPVGGGFHSAWPALADMWWLVGGENRSRRTLPVCLTVGTAPPSLRLSPDLTLHRHTMSPFAMSATVVIYHEHNNITRGGSTTVKCGKSLYLVCNMIQLWECNVQALVPSRPSTQYTALVYSPPECDIVLA